MDAKIKYYNDLLVRFEEIFYQECSNMVHPKVEYIGNDFLMDKNIEGNTLEEVIESCIKEITKAGLAEEIEYSIGGGGLLLTLNVEGCIHIGMEEKLKEGFKNEGGVQPYLCPIGNMILGQIMEKLKFEMVYNAQMNIDTEAESCKVKCAMYEDINKIGQVWKEE